VGEPHEQLSWLMFVCCSCGEETFVGVPDDQEDEQTALMLLMLYGDPPRCTGCQHNHGDCLPSVLPLNRSQRRRLRRRGYCQP